MKRRLWLALGGLVVAGAMVPAASADPINAPGSSQVNAICSGSITVVVNGNGNFTPAHVIGSTSVFIPTAFNTTITFTPPGGGPPESNTNTSAKAGPVKDGTTTCTLPLQPLFSGPMGSATIQGTVTGFFTPR